MIGCLGDEVTIGLRCHLLKYMHVEYISYMHVEYISYMQLHK